MSLLRRVLPAAAAVIAFTAGAANAQTASAKPNFNGEWVLDAAKSNFGPVPAPTSMTYKIEQAGTTLKVSSAQSGQMGDMTSAMSYTTDGVESKNTTPQGDMTSSVKYDGAALVMTSKISMQGQDVGLADRWTLSPDGKTLTIARVISAPMGELPVTLVMNKKS